MTFPAMFKEPWNEHRECIRTMFLEKHAWQQTHGYRMASSGLAESSCSPFRPQDYLQDYASFYYDHSTCMYYGHSTRMYYDHAYPGRTGRGICMFFI